MKGFDGFLLIFLFLAACDGSDPSPLADNPDYFPLTGGTYQIYDVHTKAYFEGGIIEEATYEMKTEMTDSFPSGDGAYTYVIHRSTRSSPEDSWQPLDIWSARKDRDDLIITEGNIPYVKIKGPYLNEMAWNGNAYNNLGEDEYVLQQVDVPRELNGISFEKTLMIEQERNDDVIVFTDQREEIYAADAGLVYKKVMQLHYCTDDVCLGQQKVDQGIEMTMTIKEYGKM